MKEDKIKYDLRIRSIHSNQIEEIKLKYPCLKFRETNRSYTDKTIFALIFNLGENDLKLIEKFILEFEIEEYKYDLFISFTTYKDMSGISVPKEISNLLRIIGGNIEINIINLMNMG